MRTEHHLERIVIVPRNGYANRLQAWASAEILGAGLGVQVEVLWEPEPVAPATAGDLFSPELVVRSCISPEALTDILGAAHGDLPRYLTSLPDRRAVVLAGHDRGEQGFMPELLRRLSGEPPPTTVIIIAGGKFCIDDEAQSFDFLRHQFYRSIAWSADIAERVNLALANRSEFLGLHVRGTDRSLEAPTPRAIRRALIALRDRTGINAVFISADSSRARVAWERTALHLGLAPWTSGSEDFDRSRVRAGQDALVDWIILGRAVASIYSESSSFGGEAAVASGSQAMSLPLRASLVVQHVRRARAFTASAVTYPRRRWTHSR